MEDLDKADFWRLIKGHFGAQGRLAPEDVGKAYWDRLKPYPFAVVVEATRRAERDRPESVTPAPVLVNHCRSIMKGTRLPGEPATPPMALLEEQVLGEFADMEPEEVRSKIRESLGIDIPGPQ